jgi:putative cell wall-binding protein
MFCSNTPWSITLNPAQFDIDQTKAHTVTLRRVADGMTWTFSDRTTSTSGQYFRTDFSGMGVRNVFIFRPAPTAVQYRPGDEFDVTLSVYVKGQATPRSVSYRTQFVSMLERDAYEPDDSRQTASELLVGQTQPRTFDVEGDQDWVYFDARKGVKLQIASPGVSARLYNASNQLLQTFSGTKTEWTPPADGRYHLLLEGSSVGYEAKRYELSVIDPTVVPTQVMGATRYETAVEASKLAFPKGASTVVIATGRSWPDALGGTALAGVLNGPILLTDTNALPASVTQELTRLGASRAIIVGGTGAVGTAVESELKKRFGTSKVERIAGSDRYQTADKVATRVMSERGSAYDGMAFVATGINFPDALAAAPVAASKGWPIFLVNPSAPSSAVNRPAMAPVTDVAILGGTGAVSAGVEAELNKRLGADSVERVSGACRYSTAAAVACWATERTDLRWSGLGIATGEGFPDALAGGVLQGKRGSVLLLTHPKALSPDAAATIAGTQLCISEVTFLGGTGAVAHEVRNEVIEILY